MTETICSGDIFVCLESLILSFTSYNSFAYFKFHSDWGRVIGKIKQNEVDCRDTALLSFRERPLFVRIQEKPLSETSSMSSDLKVSNVGIRTTCSPGLSHHLTTSTQRVSLMADFFSFFLHVCLRYIFKNQKKAGLQELGPRFTLKLRSLQRGTFDSKFGEYEWIHKVCEKMIIRSL